MNTTFGNIFAPVNESYCDTIDWNNIQYSSMSDLLESQYESFYFVESVLNILECTNILNESESDNKDNKKKFNFKEFLDNLKNRVKELWDKFIGFIRKTYDNFINKMHELYLNNNLYDKYFIKKSEKFDYSIIDKAAEIAKNDNRMIKLYEIERISAIDFDNEYSIMKKITKENIDNLTSRSESINNTVDYIEAKNIYNDLLKSINNLKNDIKNKYSAMASYTSLLSYVDYEAKKDNEYAKQDGNNTFTQGMAKLKADIKGENNKYWKTICYKLSEYDSNKFKNVVKEIINDESNIKKELDILKKEHIKKPSYKYKEIEKQIDTCKKYKNDFSDEIKTTKTTGIGTSEVTYSQKINRDNIKILYLQSKIQLMNLDMYINNACCKQIMYMIKSSYIYRLSFVFSIYNLCQKIVKSDNKKK